MLSREKEKITNRWVLLKNKQISCWSEFGFSRPEFPDEMLPNTFAKDEFWWNFLSHIQLNRWKTNWSSIIKNDLENIGYRVNIISMIESSKRFSASIKSIPNCDLPSNECWSFFSREITFADAYTNVCLSFVFERFSNNIMEWKITKLAKNMQYFR